MVSGACRHVLRLSVTCWRCVRIFYDSPLYGALIDEEKMAIEKLEAARWVPEPAGTEND
jgi:hypothetical protein